MTIPFASYLALVLGIRIVRCKQSCVVDGIEAVANASLCNGKGIWACGHCQPRMKQSKQHITEDKKSLHESESSERERKYKK